MENVVTKVDSKIKELSDNLTKYQEHLNNFILPEIKKLKTQKKAIMHDMAVMNGAVQAYQSSVQIMKEDTNIIHGEVV